MIYYKSKLFLFLSLMLLVLSGCEKEETINSIPDFELKSNRQNTDRRDFTANCHECNDAYVLTVILFYNSQDAHFWEQKWKITVDSNDGVRLYFKDDSIQYMTTFYEEGGNPYSKWSTDSGESKFPPYDEMRVFRFHFPTSVEEKIFRLKLEHYETGQILYSDDFILQTDICNDPDCTVRPLGRDHKYHINHLISRKQ